MRDKDGYKRFKLALGKLHIPHTEYSGERKAKELSDFKTMFVLSNRYQKAIELRNYIEAVKSHSMKNGNVSEDIQIWIEWAKKKADWFDPFINAPDEYLDDFDKNKIDA